MNNRERLLEAAFGYVFVMLGGALAIMQGSQCFWSQQYPHVAHRGSAFAAGFGIAAMVIGIIWLSTSMKLSAKE